MKKLIPITLAFVFIFSRISAQPVVSGQLMGQLGNQLFIIAATVSLALDHDAVPVFPDLAHNKDYGIPRNFELFFSHLNHELPEGQSIEHIYSEPFCHYTPIPYQPNMLISGYFQSEKYFAHHKKEIVDLFKPSLEILTYLNDKYQYILHHPDTVSIHFRSYQKEDPLQLAHIETSKAYYKKAISKFPNKNTLFVVFSNNVSKAKKLLSGIKRNFVFIENEEYHFDFYLMSMCKHNIICNSSFSWWAAYLNSNTNKTVIAPGKWFNLNYKPDTQDMVPKEWIILKL